MLLHALCFLSGAAALIYEIAWMRLLALLFGATAPAVATVLFCFMGGLGLGAYAGGRLVAGRERPLRLYAGIEGTIGAWALFIILLSRALPLAQMGPAGPGGDVLRFLLCLIVLLPPTAAMGATLPVLLQAAGMGRVATLYGANTAGAVAGTLTSGFLLIERLGLSGTQGIAVAINLGIGLIALSLSRRPPTAHAQGARTDAAPPLEREALPAGVVLACAGLCGLCSLALEVLLTRALDLMTYSTVYAFSTILAVFLLGIALGSSLAERSARPRTALAAWLMLHGVGTLISPALLSAAAHLFPDPSKLARAPGPSLRLGLIALGVLALPTLAAGAAFPLCARLYRPLAGLQAGRRVGAVYLVNTLGTMAGSVGAGFVLLPFLGLEGSLQGLGALAFLGALLCAGRASLIAPAVLVLAVLAALPRLSGVRLPHDLYASLSDEWQIVAVEDGPSTSVMVARGAHNPDRVGLWLNGNYVAGSGGGHLLLAHLPMLRHGQVGRVLGACMGTGQTFGIMASYPIEHMDCVEISEEVVRTARTHFARFSRGLFDRKNVSLHIADVRRFLREGGPVYDIVTAEPLQPWTRGTVALYSREYYELVRRALRPHGLAVQWIPLYELSLTDLRGIVATFQDVFPETELWIDWRDVILIGAERLPKLAPAELAPVLRRPEVRSDLKRLYIEDIETLLSKRALSTQATRRFAAGGRVIRDDQPYLEMSAPRAIGRDTVPENLRGLIASWDVSFAECGADAARFAAAGRAMRAAMEAEAADLEEQGDTTALYLTALRHAPHHGQVFKRTAARVQRALDRGHPQGFLFYEDLLRMRPDFAEGHINYGAALSRAGKLAEAEAAMDRGLAASARVRPLWLINRGVLAARRSQYEKARDLWEEYLKEHPQNETIKQYLRRLPR